MKHNGSPAGPEEIQDWNRVVVVGGSAGASAAMATLLGAFDQSCDAVFLFVRHIHADSADVLPSILNRATDLEVVSALSGAPLRRGTVYLAPPDRHLTVDSDSVRLTRGPKENRSRPAIDVLFRSAAVNHGARVIGVLLSGMLDDGVAGLNAIKRCGGTVVVQAPEDAEYPQMPRNAVEGVDVDHILPVDQIPELLKRLFDAPPPPSPSAPADLVAETLVAGGPVKGESLTRPLGDPADYSCPDCGGPLHRVENGSVRRYRCLVGHAYSRLTLLEGQQEATERALWAAVRMLDERTRMLKRLASESRSRGSARLAESYDEGIAESAENAQVLRNILVDQPSD